MTAKANKKSKKPKTLPTDFNDLHRLEGLEAVRVQLDAAIAAFDRGDAVPDVIQQPAANDAPPVEAYEDVPAPEPDTDVKALGLEAALKRFAMTVPKNKVWDSHGKQILPKSDLETWLGKDTFKLWFDHEERRTVDFDTVSDLAREASAAKEARLAKKILGPDLERYVYIYPTSDVWDCERCQTVPIASLRYAMGNGFEFWLNSPTRRQIDIENLVFDPTQQCDPKTTINKFKGLPLKPADDPASAALFEMHLSHLCNDDEEITNWVLNWIAYQVQNVGAKMATALMFHSDVQGTGKSLFFEGVLRKIFGEYGATLGQHQLESQYTDWRSGLLYGLFEEVLSRDQKYSHTGTIKHMITGETVRIEKKFVSGWEEANFMNGVFLSNEIQPFPIEASDRRMCVVWPNSKLSQQLQDLIVAAIDDGSVAAFYGALLKRDVSGFGPHTKPPDTEAKQRLVAFGRSGWECFVSDWQAGRLDSPCVTCATRQLYKVYERWCHESRENTLSFNKFVQFLRSKFKYVEDKRYSIGVSVKKASFFVIEDLPPMKPDTTLQGWLGEAYQSFQKTLDKVANKK